jgi:3-hydroxybutyrate dehydrogenase
MADHLQRVALVTGAASGIGAAITERFIADGLTVVAADLNPPPAGAASTVVADLSTRAGNRAVVDAALDRFGRLDVVVANAGFQHVAPVADFPEDRWDALLSILLTSPFLLAKYAWPALTASGSGRFLAIASAHALVASPYKAGYVAAKHGVLGLVKTLALEGAPVGITTSALCPAYVRTPLVEKQIQAQAEAHGMNASQVLSDVILAPQAVKRLVEPAEVAAMAAFLVGPAGGSITGAAIPMDLGWTAR